MQAAPTPTAATTLVRAIGVRTLAASVVNSIVGSGIFALPAAVAAILGPSAPVAYFACAVAIGLVALCFAEAGSRIATSGGVYRYIEAAFGPYLGFVAGVLFWIGSQVIAMAALAALLVDSLGTFVPWAGGRVARAEMIVALFATLAVINVRGVRAGARVMASLTVLKVAPLALLILGGMLMLHPAYLAGMRVPPPSDLGRACILLIFAFTGVEAALSASGEVQTPSRTVPRAVLLGVAVVVLLYVGLQVVSQGVLGAALAREQTTALAAVAGRVGGAPARAAILGAASLSILGTISGDMLMTPRVPFAFAETGLLPAWVGVVHARYRTPYVAIVTHAVICTAIALSGSFRSLAVVSVVATMLLYVGCCAAVLELRRRDVRTDAPPFRVPGGPFVPLLACGVVVWLLASATRAEYLAVAAMIAAASALYVARRALQRTASPALS